MIFMNFMGILVESLKIFAEITHVKDRFELNGGGLGGLGALSRHMAVQ